MMKPMNFKASEVTDEGRFFGLASTFTEDLGGDVIVPGAFRKTLAEHAASGVPIVMLRDHDRTQPVGVWEAIVETAKGLEVTGRLTLAVEKARETLALLRDGALTGLSIGYQTRDASRDPKTGVRRLERVDLHEISLVAMPMNPLARVVAVKADEVETQRDFERFLRDAGWSRDRAKVLSKAFAPVNHSRRDADRQAAAQLAEFVRTRAEAISRSQR